MILKQSTKKGISLLLSILLIFGLVCAAYAAPVNYGAELSPDAGKVPAISFSDVPQSYWAYDKIAEMFSRKIINGYPDGKFRPENIVSRGEFAKIIVKAVGIQATKVNYSSFSDVKTTDWTSPFVEAVKDYMTGYRLANGQYIFNPNAPALREDMVIAIVKLKGYDMRLADRSIIEAMFSDYEGISESAKDSVALAVENGLASGYPNGTFRAQASITRSEAAALLWRAFLYGNDNKGVGTQEPVTPGQTLPNQQQNPQQQTQTQPAKFTVETLAGGIGAGNVDGPVSVAKINQVDSMVLDKNDNVYFLDASNKKVRKFENANGVIGTHKVINESFNYDSSENGLIKTYEGKSFLPKNLEYNSASDKVLLTGLRTDNDKLVNIFEISQTVNNIVYYSINSLNPNNPWRIRTQDFITVPNEGSILFGFSDAGADSYIVQKSGNTYSVLANSAENTGVKLIPEYTDFGRTAQNKADVIVINDDIWIFDCYAKKLSKIHLFPRKVDTIIAFDNKTFDSVTTYDGKFYLSNGSSIFELNREGQLKTFVDGKDLTYLDGNPITAINHFGFDSKGNVILYDDNSKAIRRINL